MYFIPKTHVVIKVTKNKTEREGQNKGQVNVYASILIPGYKKFIELFFRTKSGKNKVYYLE